MPDPTRHRYAAHDDGFADLWVPEVGAGGAVPVVVLVHGGFWRERYRLDLMDGLAASLAGAGFAAWNVEYRRVGAGGGFPWTFDDVAAALDHLTGVDAPLDLDRVAVVGHSAGGQLAAWLASRHRLPADAPGASPQVRSVLAVPMAGVLDLRRAARTGVGDTACHDLLGGGPDEVPDRYAVASPIALVPTGVPMVVVHGTGDDTVPLEQSERYVAAATEAGDQAELVTVDDAGHMDVIDPGHRSWAVVLDQLRRHLS